MNRNTNGRQSDERGWSSGRDRPIPREEWGETERERSARVSSRQAYGGERGRSPWNDRYTDQDRDRGPWDTDEDSWSRRASGNTGYHARAEDRWPDPYERDPGYGEWRGAQQQGYPGYAGPRRYEQEAGGYTGGHRNAWNDSARWEQRAQRPGRGPGGYGDVRTGNTLRYGESAFGSSSSGYTSPFDEENRSTSASYGASLRQRGPFSGRGPKGYQRSDERIREDACERLTYDPDIDASEVVVTVSGGEVTLSGEVENRHQKRLAEDLVEDVPGVKDVHNRLSSRRGIIGSVVDDVTGRGRDENNVGKGPKPS